MAFEETERRTNAGLRLGTVIVACALCVASTSFLLAAMSHAAWNGFDIIIGVVNGLLAGFGLICAMVLRAWRLPVALALAGAVLVAAGAASGAPLTLRWQASEPAFSQWIATHPHADTYQPFRLGLFDVQEVKAGPSGLLFYDDYGDLSDTGDGIAYIPAGTAGFACPADIPCELTALGGPWYAWVGYS